MLICIENFLSKSELESIQNQLETANWIDGNQTAGSRSKSVKSNLQLSRTDPLAATIGNQILRAMGSNPTFTSAALAETIWPPMFNCYQGGGHYGLHVDSALMHHPELNMRIRSDVSATVFLNAPEDYEGGELMIEDTFGAQSVKLDAGSMVLYPSSSLHQVMPVTRGKRLAAVTWIQSSVASSADRALLYDLDQSIQSLSVGRSKTDPSIDRLIQVYHNLLRKLAQV